MRNIINMGKIIMGEITVLILIFYLLRNTSYHAVLCLGVVSRLHTHSKHGKSPPVGCP
jgi:hypothetical protein